MAKQTVKQVEEKRAKVSQLDFPLVDIVDALRIPKALWDNFAGKNAAPHDVALALDLSPTSSGWRSLCGASIAYGLSDGGYAAPQISLTELGRRIVAPTEDGDELSAMSEALLKPRIQREFFKKYDRAKFPREDIAENVLVQLGLPKDRANAALIILKQNGKDSGVIRETKTGPFVALGAAALQTEPDESSDTSIHDAVTNGGIREVGSERAATNERRTFTNVVDVNSEVGKKVFITHGKNTKIMEQIKKLVTLGGFVPIVSVQRETAAKPVPDKVMDDMRSCGAAVIHVGTDGSIIDNSGMEHPQLNPNVLIEIGAAMALYRGRFILVVEEGVKLPTNLQGLYECRYEGDGLDMDAGMKILEALRGLS